MKVDAENPQMVSEEEFLAKLPEIAANAETDACTPENPRETKAADFEKILKACYYDTDIDFYSTLVIVTRGSARICTEPLSFFF